MSGLSHEKLGTSGQRGRVRGGEGRQLRAHAGALLHGTSFPTQGRAWHLESLPWDWPARKEEGIQEQQLSHFLVSGPLCSATYS